MMADELNINEGDDLSVFMHEDLRKRVIGVEFVPQRLTDEQKQRTLILCQAFIQACEDNSRAPRKT
jgi:hypothetical protein